MEPRGRNRWQPVANGTRSKPLKQADPQPVASDATVVGSRAARSHAVQPTDLIRHASLVCTPDRDPGSAESLIHEVGLAPARW